MLELIRLLNIPQAWNVVALTRTSDGHFLAMQQGDCGFNIFLGRPRFHDGPGRDSMRETWKHWRFGQRRQAYKQARRLGLNVRNMLGAES